jgi:hypothetical protein
MPELSAALIIVAIATCGNTPRAFKTVQYSGLVETETMTVIDQRDPAFHGMTCFRNSEILRLCREKEVKNEF